MMASSAIDRTSSAGAGYAALWLRDLGGHIEVLQSTSGHEPLIEVLALLEALADRIARMVLEDAGEFASHRCRAATDLTEAIRAALDGSPGARDQVIRRAAGLRRLLERLP